MTTPEYEPTPGDIFLEMELRAMHPDMPADRSGSWTFGELSDFMSKHRALMDRLDSGVGHLLDESIVDSSRLAEEELQALGIDPKVFRDAFVIAEAGIARVIGW